MKMSTTTKFMTTALVASVLLAPVSALAGNKDQKYKKPKGHGNEFRLTRPAGVPDTCAPNAKGFVRITSLGEAERMEVFVQGMPKRSEVEVFTTQVPEFPFGMSWYVGDIETNKYGKGYATFVSRFNEETFVVAPGTAVAPTVHAADASDNPATAPVHTYHVGLWFSSPEDAASLGCPDVQTPFNGEHDAGIQVLNTGTFPDTEGPLLDE